MNNSKRRVKEIEEFLGNRVIDIGKIYKKIDMFIQYLKNAINYRHICLSSFHPNAFFGSMAVCCLDRIYSFTCCPSGTNIP
jgi:hypothetical protein